MNPKPPASERTRYRHYLTKWPVPDIASIWREYINKMSLYTYKFTLTEIKHLNLLKLFNWKRNILPAPYWSCSLVSSNEHFYPPQPDIHTNLALKSLTQLRQNRVTFQLEMSIFRPYKDKVMALICKSMHIYFCINSLVQHYGITDGEIFFAFFWSSCFCWSYLFA